MHGTTHRGIDGEAAMSTMARTSRLGEIRIDEPKALSSTPKVTTTTLRHLGVRRLKHIQTLSVDHHHQGPRQDPLLD